jgi:hypothetical protein
MDFNFPFVDVLVLPVGATSGQRIIIDGVNGTIEVYDANDVLIGFFGPFGGFMQVFVRDPSGANVQLAAGSGVAAIELNPPDFATHTVVTGRFQADIDETPGDPYLVLGSPTIDGGTDMRLFIIGEGVSGGRPRVVVDAGDDSDADLVVNDRPIGLGLLRQQSLASSEAAAHSGSATTDMALSNVSVIAGNTYAIHLGARLQLAGASVSEWEVNVHINGTEFQRIAHIENTAAVTYNTRIDGTVYWTPSVTAATDDIDIRIVESAGAQTFQLVASATARRTLSLIHLGITG